MTNCRVRSARKRRSLPNVLYKEIGIQEYSLFTKTIDPRIKTECIACPLGSHLNKYWCAWRFTTTK